MIRTHLFRKLASNWFGGSMSGRQVQASLARISRQRRKVRHEPSLSVESLEERLLLSHCDGGPPQEPFSPTFLEGVGDGTFTPIPELTFDVAFGPDHVTATTGADGSFTTSYPCPGEDEIDFEVTSMTLTASPTPYVFVPGFPLHEIDSAGHADDEFGVFRNYCVATLQQCANPNVVTRLDSAPFRVYRPFTISGRVYEDLNVNGMFDPDVDLPSFEQVGPAPPGCTWLFTPGQPPCRDRTDADGVYTLQHLVPGVRVSTTSMDLSPDELEVTQPRTPMDRVTRSGEDHTDWDIGLFSKIEIFGLIFNDLNGDGQREHGVEPFLPDVTVQLDLNNDGTIDRTAVTALGGVYRFKNIGSGTHRVAQVVPDDQFQTLPVSSAGHVFRVGDGSPEKVFQFDFGVTDQCESPARSAGRAAGTISASVAERSSGVILGTTQDVCSAPFIVDSFGDERDDVGDGRCDVAPSPDVSRCTLRAAIEESNRKPDENVITFKENITSISLIDPLPPVIHRIFINGSGEQAGRKVEITRSPGAPFDALVISGGNSIVQGLAINGFLGGESNGIVLNGGGGNSIRANYIGLTGSGLQAAGNSGSGIVVRNSSDNTIGGATESEANVISANGQHGIHIESGVRNRVEGNLIGTDKNGMCTLDAQRNCSLGNGETGILVSGGTDNRIGGTATGAGNTVAFNGTGASANPAGGHGIVVMPSARVSILSNSVFSNTGLGIDLVETPEPGSFKRGVTPNDNIVYTVSFSPGDTDTGANELQNFPELSIGPDGRIEGTLNSAPSASYRIEFFASPTPNPLGHGDGRQFLPEFLLQVPTDQTGYAVFTVATAPPANQFITATATRIVNASGDQFEATSEFSPPARRIERGVTVITHGFVPQVFDGDSLLPLAQAIHNRTGGCLLNYDAVQGGEGTFPADKLFCQPNIGGDSGAAEVILLFDWAPESNETSSNAWSEAAGDALFGLLVSEGLVNPANVRSNPAYHFIAHSFGAAVTSEVVERFARFGVNVNHLTYLDPHDFNQRGQDVDENQEQSRLGRPQGYGASVWNNVAFADVYYESRGRNDGAGVPGDFLFVPRGRPIPGAYNRLLEDADELPAISTFGPYSGLEVSGDHSYVWNCFYIATVTGNLPAGCPNPERSHVEVEYATAGYAFSRMAFFPQSRPPSRFLDDPGDPRNRQVHDDSEPAPVPLPPPPGGWEPQWNQYTIFHGDFDHPNLDNLLVDFQPGYSDHGGGGEGHIDANLNTIFTGNWHLELDDGDESRTHNYLYFPNPAEGLSLLFEFQITDTSSDDQFQIRVDDALLGNRVPLTDEFKASLGSQGTTQCIEVPTSLQRDSHTLTFEIVPGGGSTESEVEIDTVRFLAGRCQAGTQRVFQRVQGTLRPGEQQTSRVSISPDVRQASFSLNWPGSDLDLELVAPDGSVVTRESATMRAGIQFDEGPTSESFTIDFPLPGTWDVRVKAVDVAPEGEPFEFLAASDSGLSITGGADRESFQLRESVNLQVNLNDGSPILDASVVANISPPAGSAAEQVVLFDDGSHNDGLSGDGIYGNQFQNTFVAGQYGLRFDVQGQANALFDFSRTVESDFEVVPDTTGPTVDRIDLVRDARGKKVLRIVLTFSEPLTEAGAETLSNYVVETRTRTRAKPIALRSAVYDAGTVTLTPLKAIATKKLATVFLTARATGSLTDSSPNLNPLDGDRNGAPGGDFVRSLSQPAILSVIDELLETGEFSGRRRLIESLESSIAQLVGPLGQAVHYHGSR